MTLPDYLPIEVIFNLLCVCRRIQATSTQSIRRAMYRRGLYYGTYDMLPRFSFWIKLCQSAALLDEQLPPRPTLFVPDWLALSLPDQFDHLLDTWYTASSIPRIQRVRRELPQLLLDQEELSQTHRKELIGLQALGFCSDDVLTHFGYHLLTDKSTEFDLPAPSTWKIVSHELHVSYPPEWSLLWELEVYLEPIDPGIYPIDKKAIRKAVQQGEREGSGSLTSVVERGLQEPLPQDLAQCLESQPTVKVLSGPVLEFSSQDELLALRQNASMRRDLSRILSSHHVHIETWQADRILNRLGRLGLLSEKDIQHYGEEAFPSPTVLSRSDQAYLLSLMIISDGLGVRMSAPPGLLGKLTAGLPMILRTSAARKASKALDEALPRPTWVPEEELPPIPEPQIIEKMESAINKQVSVDVLYQKADQYQAEYRRLTPLMIEQRGLRFYLIAYCHKRRANRTFRLDRLQLLDEPPVP